ncbi:MAG: Polysaccharide deacetylase family protein [Candidatus Hydrogenedentes bacterium]|nr:Polysaccharide deacetylase family protein [Candidatus Hydrogenedentota bacterium]
MCLCIHLIAGIALGQAAAAPVPDKTVVLCFDDAVRSHLEFVAPLLERYGFGATFFISHLWMEDTEHFITWEEVAQLHRRGFEIGNHTWTHGGFGSPESAGQLEDELDRIDDALAAVGVPKPVSFAWPGNGFGPESARVLEQHGIRFARRGMQPEVPYGAIQPGPLFDPKRHHPLLIPTAGDAYPEWSLDAFKAVVDRAKDGQIAVVQFHGVPDIVHPWVHTPPERFQEYMDYLRDNGFHVLALRDIAPYLPDTVSVDDPMTTARYPEKK